MKLASFLCVLIISLFCCSAEWKALDSYQTRGSNRFGHASVIYKDTLVTSFGLSKPRPDKTAQYDSSVCAYNITAKKWKLLSPSLVSSTFPAPRHGHTFTVIDNDRSCIFGGEQAGKQTGNQRKSHPGGTFSNDLWCLNHTSSDWTLMIPDWEKPPPRFGHTAVYFRGQLIIFGGLVAGSLREKPENRNDIWKFTWSSSMRGKWEEIVDGQQDLVPDGRHYHSSELYEDKMYVFGGVRAENAGSHQKDLNFNDFWAYDISTRIWSNLPISSNPSQSMITDKTHQGSTATPSARFSHQIVLWKDQLLLHGGTKCDVGCEAISDFWMYSFREKSWQPVKMCAFESLKRSKHTLNVTPQNLLLSYGGELDIRSSDGPSCEICLFDLNQLAAKTCSSSAAPIPRVDETLAEFLQASYGAYAGFCVGMVLIVYVLFRVVEWVREARRRKIHNLRKKYDYITSHIN